MHVRYTWPSYPVTPAVSYVSSKLDGEGNTDSNSDKPSNQNKLKSDFKLYCKTIGYLCINEIICYFLFFIVTFPPSTQAKMASKH